MEQRRVLESAPGLVADDDAGRAAVLEQLERILASPLFKNSKRYPPFLRYVVEQTLNGHGDRIKERTLGVGLFGRDPDYDTNSDHAVRSTAGEIRKRIAQYYHQPGRQNEVVIDLPSGSYVPEFRFPAEPASAPVMAAAPAADSTAPKPWYRRWAVYVAAAVAFACMVAAQAWVRPAPANTALDRFWEPILRSSEPVLLCVAKSICLACDPPVKPPEDAEANVNNSNGGKQIAFADAVTLARLAGLFDSHRREYRFRLETAAHFQDLRDGPAVLIGGFNNSWTMRLNDQLHFVLAGTPAERSYWIEDRQGGAGRKWLVHYDPKTRIKEDYALVSRALDANTGHIVVAIAGIGGFGTRAAGELLTNSASFDSVAARLPAGWERKNLQLVVETKVIDEGAGKPQVVAQAVW
ncbi:MAG: hypothetical protein C5B51_12655 [Terriglobia bacterium]|nr:MAG: hypothetical protein C5B51_12655 [Terriglobia bacterium]